MRRGVVEFAARNGATDRQCQDIALAVSEAVTNTVRHAYPNSPSPGAVAVRAAISGGMLEVVVSDQGVGMPAPRDHPVTGRGLAIIATVADRLELRDMTPGTWLQMTFAIG